VGIPNPLIHNPLNSFANTRTPLEPPSQEKVRPETRRDDGSFEVRLPEGLDDALNDVIERRYDELLTLNRQLFETEQTEDVEDCDAAGLVVNLADGSTVYADIPPRLLGRVMEVLTAEELGELVNAIVDAVERPDQRSLCQRVRDRETGKRGPA
jgi:hypothetical protein